MDRQAEIEALKKEMEAIELFDKHCDERGPLTDDDRNAMQNRALRRQKIRERLATLFSRK
jgi:hypothetical protein